MPATTLEKIGRYGAIYIGYRESAVPFSYLDADGKVVGYSWELCLHIAEAVRARLDRPDLAVVPVPVTPGSRQTMIESGTIDLKCGALSNTGQRQRTAAFSVTTFVAEVQALVRRDAGIAALKEMQGKVVSTTTGSTSEVYLRALAQRQGLNFNYRYARDPAAALRQLQNGVADVVALDNVLLKNLLVGLPAADRAGLRVLDETFAVEPYAIMFRRKDPEFKKLVDDTLIGLMESGEFARIYAKWFTSPIPPGGIDLDLPMSDLLKQLILTPNDRGV